MCGIATVTPGLAETGTSQTAQALVDAATETVLKIKSDKRYDSKLGDAKAIFLIPKLGKEAFTAGGTGAQGVLLKHDNDGSWSGPAFVTVNSISIGAQAGRQAGPAAMLLMTSKAVGTFTKVKRVTIDEDAGLTIVGYVARNGSPLGAGDIELWSDPTAAFAGASIEGATLTQDLGQDRSYYGKQVRVSDILSGRVTQAKAGGLRKVLPL